VLIIALAEIALIAALEVATQGGRATHDDASEDATFGRRNSARRRLEEGGGMGSEDVGQLESRPGHGRLLAEGIER
jgi:hypothetical protein